MDPISLIIRGDDFGLCQAVNQAIWEAFETGVLTCASLAVTGPWVAEAAGLARDHPEWEIGLQLVLTCEGAGCRWGPVAGAQAVPSLVDATGQFPPQLSPSAAADDLGRELQAQVERAHAWGLSPAYLEYSGEAPPAVDEILHGLSEHLGVAARMTTWGLQPLVPSADLQPSSEPSVLEVLKSLSPGVYLWVTHPAQETPETWGLWADEKVARSRQADLTALCHPAVAAVIQQRGIELISFRQFLEVRLGTQTDE
jgi:chitin disaccharide deacetylase